MKSAISTFHKAKENDLVMDASNFFGEIINIHPFEYENRRICRLILANILMQVKCSLFPLLLSSFHRRGRRHYIGVIKMYERKTSMLYTFIVKSLTRCWNNSLQKPKMSR